MEKQMNKKMLVDCIAESAGITKVQAEKALVGMLDSITDCLKNGDKLTLVSFGTFSTSRRAARTGRNPQNGKAVNIPAKTVIKFKAGKAMGDEVNNG